MKLRQMLLSAMLLSAGYVLHLLVTPLAGGMKFDLLLSTLFVALLLIRDFRTNLLTGLLAGLIAALTTSFPGGQLPNILDKLVVTLFVIVLVRATAGRLPVLVTAVLAAGLGTLLSGAVFLSTALLLSGLPLPFSVLFTTIVVPATLANCFLTGTMAAALKPVSARYRHLLQN